MSGQQASPERTTTHAEHALSHSRTQRLSVRRHAWPVDTRWAGVARGAGIDWVVCPESRLLVWPFTLGSSVAHSGEFLARMRSSVRVAMTCRVWPCVALINGAAGGLAERHDRAQAE